MRALAKAVGAAALMMMPLLPACAVDLPTLKKNAIEGVERRAKLAQVMNDSIFSFGELGFQEVETAKYVTSILKKNGFQITRGVAGLPTAWLATWTSGKGGPVIAIGSDVDAIPKASQKPGVPWREPLVEGAPGHGEGHNSGQALNVVAALALQEVMKRDGVAGTLVLWPGIAEELAGGKAYMVRDGLFDKIDAVIFTHVEENFLVSWGQYRGTGMVSVEYAFHGASAHAAGAPWLGRSALDAAMLMGNGWDMRREHLRTEQRSHYVISNGGDQPNVVPSEAAIWFFLREQTFDALKASLSIADEVARGAAIMTGTTSTRRILGAAAPRHFNRPMAEAAYENIKAVGLPNWNENEQTFAKTLQKELGATPVGLPTELPPLQAPVEKPESGGSDDIGDLSWTLPTVNIRYPANIGGLPGHSWADAVAMATPIAHKGVVAGAKVVAMTTLDLLVQPELLRSSKAYFNEVQLAQQKYVPMLSAKDAPPIDTNAAVMEKFRPAMRRFYYDPAKYSTYLDQLGVPFPYLKKVPK